MEESMDNSAEPGRRDRMYWLETIGRIGSPVLGNLARRRLKEAMPVEALNPGQRSYTHLEALGRLLCGMAPWLELEGLDGREEELRRRAAALAREAIDAATDPASPDAMNFTEGGQPIVDAAFLSLALIRAPRALWGELDERVKRNAVHALKATRTRKPGFNNWLLFAAVIETALFLAGEPDWDRMRIDYALRQHEQWYCGDGTYGDGPHYRADYYNSFVIQPMLVDLVRAIGGEEPDWQAMAGPVMERAVRYAEIQERMISPEGTFPPIGRSLAYRCGAFHALAQIALLERLPGGLEPAGVRSALTAVIRRTLSAPGTFDAEGWLRIGFCGSQPEIGERYISTGSLYLCAAAFLPLGLAPTSPFWQGEGSWTAKRAWSGEPFAIDHALRDPH
ncbi:DUF2264 domain-containing protein [Paenibacillus humicola]|uniref:DUF2264 domain-containing protein n=1 Tax=Paenibacillus humicola TaxID=3110540 RepID=UPI00237C456C|nr:DUF2264 domain-containing protein [Paenibacillus humicola]